MGRRIAIGWQMPRRLAGGSANGSQAGSLTDSLMDSLTDSPATMPTNLQRICNESATNPQ